MKYYFEEDFLKGKKMVQYTALSFLVFEVFAFFYHIAKNGPEHLGVVSLTLVAVGVLSYYFYKGYKSTAYFIVMLLAIISLFSGWLVMTLLILMVLALFIFLINNDLFTYMDVMRHKRLQIKKAR
ncbi:MAG TPA: hypothetical protein DDY49_13725 [Paenibacillaceae bacterium]|nr:hypothetical protein [Paenibacillaceae bacterium]